MIILYFISCLSDFKYFICKVIVNIIRKLTSDQHNWNCEMLLNNNNKLKYDIRISIKGSYELIRNMLSIDSVLFRHIIKDYN